MKNKKERDFGGIWRSDNYFLFNIFISLMG